MRKVVALLSLLVVASAVVPRPANAFIFLIIPIPNVAKPPQLQKVIDALSKSTQTHAVAYVAEKKVFASRQWTWADVAGEMSQEEADQQALDRCNQSLQALKDKTAGGQALYDFGTNTCKLHQFLGSAPTATAPVAKRAPAASLKNDPAWKSRVSAAILAGRCEEAKAIALGANDLDVAEQAVRLCVSKVP